MSSIVQSNGSNTSIEVIDSPARSATEGMEPLLEESRDSSPRNTSSLPSYRIHESLRSRVVRQWTGSEDQEGFIHVETPVQDLIADALQRCEKFLLRPYEVALKILGWTSFRRDGDKGILKLLRVLLVLFWVVVMLIAFVTQVLSCFRRDMFYNSMESKLDVINCEKGFISTFVLTDILLLASYLFGLYLFSSEATAEYLFNLAEQAFIKSSEATQGKPSNKLIYTIGLFFIFVVLWTLFSVVVLGLHLYSSELLSSQTIIRWNTSNATVSITGGLKDFTVSFSLFGFVIFDIVYVVAVMNYATQSEMCIHLLWAIKEMVVTKKYYDLDTAIKDIQECREYLRLLNGKTATATALILFNLGSLGLVGLINLNDKKRANESEDSHGSLNIATGAINTVLWLLLFVFPFIQAARVTSAADSLVDTGPQIRARPLQYSNTPQLELDSFVGATQAFRMRATIFGIPIYPWLIYSVVVIFFFSMLVLTQTEVFVFAYYF